ncbi:little elongation complex subunit 2-like [Ctenocephalides felis]|uniref:little elongation complex subunit 2-like n=1 Tax=Ctenocephalides felis TaxID=7515 RepID=UPI000E6E1194|nr:little elongation complex subunit 2-like [Ctenocephalides felis]
MDEAEKDLKKKKKKKIMKREMKKKNKTTDPRDIFSDFSFVQIPYGLHFNNIKITDEVLQTSAHYKLSYDEFLPPECFLNQSECDSSDLDLLRSKFLENNSYTYTYKQKYRKFALVRVQQSLLEKAEHEQCLRGLEIITSGCKPTLEEETDVSVFMNSEKKRFSEYSKFSQYVENIWNRKNKERLIYIQPDLKNFIKLYWRWQQNRVSNYPKNYKVMTMLPLENNLKSQQKTCIDIFPENIVHQYGKSMLLDINEFNSCSKCINDCNTLESKAIKSRSDKTKVSVSEDEVCIDMAIKYNANIVISSSGLKCLLDNHPPKYCREWIIPIVIKEFDVDYKKQKVVFVEKPLPSLRYSIHQQNQWANKISLKTSTIFGFEKLQRRAAYERKVKTELIKIQDTHEDHSEKDQDNIKKEPQEHAKDVDNSSKSLNVDVTYCPKSPCNITDDVGVCTENTENGIMNKKIITVENQECINNKEIDLNIVKSEDNKCNDHEIKLRTPNNNISSLKNQDGSDDNSDSDSDDLLIDEAFDSTDTEACNTFSNKRVTRSMTKSRSANASSESLSIDSPGNTSYTSISSRRSRSPSTRYKNKENNVSESESCNKSSIKSAALEMKNMQEYCNDLPGNLIKNETISISSNNFADTENVENKKRRLSTGEDVEYKEISDPLTTYRMWKLIEKSDAETSLLQKNSSKELKLLIRTKSHGKVKIGEVEKEVILMPKLEYQTEFGAECCSLSESIRQWCSLFFQPDTTLLRVRMHHDSSRISMHEMLDLNGVTNEVLRLHKHNPKKNLNRLFRLLNIMHSSLLPGSYILKHDVKMAEAAKLYMADNSCDSSNTQLDLRQLYENVTLDKVSLEESMWNPIDPFIITPEFEYKEYIFK